MSKVNPKEKEELKMPLSVYVDKVAQETLDVLGKSNLDIFLQEIVIEKVHKALLEVLQNQRIQYESEKVKELEEKENAKSQEKSK